MRAYGSYAFRAMNTEVRVPVGGSDDEVREAGVRVEAVFAAHEGCLSRFRPESPLLQLNRTGHLEHPPCILVEALERARRWQELLSPSFNPVVLPHLEQAG
ncbi:MAG: FAD:protein FMN transferase [Clostridiales bacterium]|nr:FAD:protein FMN transferase [Clostridiales bacterium]